MTHTQQDGLVVGKVTDHRFEQRQGDTLARTGNTARDQEMYVAGIRTGEENAKHNAAIRGGAVWLPISSAPTLPEFSDGLHQYGPNILVFAAGRVTIARWWQTFDGSASNFIDRGSCAVHPTHWMPLPAAPGVSTVEDAQTERQADACPRCEGSGEITVMSDNSPDAHDVVVCCDHCQGSGAAVDAAKYLAAALAGEKYRHMQVWAEYRNFHRSLCARFGYCHDEVHFRRDLVSLEEAIAAKVVAPAAGDALALLDHPLLRDVLGYIEDAGPADVWSAAQSWMSLRDAALAAQRKGDA